MRRYVVLLLPLAGLIELLLHFVFAARAPRFDEYPALRQTVDALRQPGDVVVMAPWWAEPMLRRGLADARMPLRDVARPDDERYGAAIEVSAMGQRSEAFASWQQDDQRSTGPFEVRRLINPAPRPDVFDFVDELTPERASVLVDGVRCGFRQSAQILTGGLAGHPTFGPRRFACGGSAYFNVGVTVIADERWRARRCIWAHPPDALRPLTIAFRNVPLGDEIVGHGGMYWVIERSRLGAPIELTVEVDGTSIGSHTHVDGDGWARFVMPLGQHARTTADVRFTVRTASFDRRHFCFEARSR